MKLNCDRKILNFLLATLLMCNLFHATLMESTDLEGQDVNTNFN